jgi:outer membrane protein assembly factor BamB
MTDSSATPTPRRPLRLWPGVVAAILLSLTWFGMTWAPEGVLISFVGGLACSAAVLLWWLFFSRAHWFDRLGAIILMIAAVYATSHVIDRSIANGAMGALFYIHVTPVLCLALVAAAVAGRHMAQGPRRATITVSILLACGIFTLLRTDGVTGRGTAQFKWRWAPTSEERLLALAPAMPEVPAKPKATVLQPSTPAGEEPAASGPAKTPEHAATAAHEPAAPSTPAAAAIPAVEWPGFRGSFRDGRIPGIRINDDWSSTPPVELWRRPIGPGWSSFAVRGDMFYTQEQRGEYEVVACYNAVTGKPAWEHRDPARFWESNGGAGPRATPTLSGSCVYSLGATGILNALSAADGSVVWSRLVPSDTGTKVPYWGASSSPLVVDGLVIVYNGKLAAYDITTGEPRWFGTDGGVSYSSPQLFTIGRIAQVVMLCNAGTASVAPGDGRQLWHHPWGSGIVQPAQTAEGDILISAVGQAGGLGTRRIAAAHGPGGWKVEERWTSNRLKPYFNDFVVHNGHAFGFDGGILACIDLQDGQRKWKGGRYGYGQLVLLPDQDLLLVLAEDGYLALVKATLDRFTELARVPAIEGKTWNHPVLAGDILLVRNGQEMVAFRLSRAAS